MIEFISGGRLATKKEVCAVYETIKTPYKYGPVLKFDDSLCDSPTVFSYNGKFYMMFVRIFADTDVSGYETHLAESVDLINWKYLYPVLKRCDSGWDSKQIGGYIGYQNVEFDKLDLIKVNDRFVIPYLGGALDGYETDPLSISLAFAEDITDPNTYTRLGKPLLTGKDADAREGEKLTLYKANLIFDEDEHLGYPYVMFYNAKSADNVERIFLAVSSDGEHFERYGDAPVIDDSYERGHKISGDPQVVKIGDLYVMFYFKYNKEVGRAYNTFAVSKDLINFVKWDGEPLIEPTEDWENKHAHKSWVIKKDGVVYHYYCAVNDKKERFIALATSKPLK